MKANIDIRIPEDLPEELLQAIGGTDSKVDLQCLIVIKEYLENYIREYDKGIDLFEEEYTVEKLAEILNVDTGSFCEGLDCSLFNKHMNKIDKNDYYKARESTIKLSKTEAKLVNSSKKRKQNKKGRSHFRSELVRLQERMCDDILDWYYNDHKLSIFDDEYYDEHYDEKIDLEFELAVAKDGFNSCQDVLYDFRDQVYQKIDDNLPQTYKAKQLVKKRN
jgi:hypothetical protein